MKDIVLLLVLLNTQTIKTSSVPFAVDSDQNCPSSTKYLKDDSDLCCNKCPPGHRLKKECTETSETVCDPCPDKQYMKHWNYAQNCFSCVVCKESKGLQYAQMCSNTTNSRCVCMPGRYCSMESNGQTCQECRQYRYCGVGYGVSVQGTANSDVKCEQCPAGTFSDTVSYTDACKPHTNCDEGYVMRKGNASSDTVCKPPTIQPNPMLRTKPAMIIVSATAGPFNNPTIQTIPVTSVMQLTNTTPSVSLSDLTTEMLNTTKSPVANTGLDKQLVAIISSVTVFFLLVIFIVLRVLCKRVLKKDCPKVDANGNCESEDNTNLWYLKDTQRLSVKAVGPEQQCLLEKLEVCSNHKSTNDYISDESIGSLQLTSPLQQPPSCLSEPMTLQSNTDNVVSQTSATTQSSSQPTSPQNINPSPLVNVNINLHIGNGACGTPSVVLTDMIPMDPEVPFGEEEESFSLPQQEAGKLSLTSVEESGVSLTDFHKH